MTPETARILAHALQTRWVAEAGLISTLSTASREPWGATFPIGGKDMLMWFAETYVHEQRIINRIVSEARDE